MGFNLFPLMTDMEMLGSGLGLPKFDGLSLRRGCAPFEAHILVAWRGINIEERNISH
jgi:hypothetical protein